MRCVILSYCLTLALGLGDAGETKIQDPGLARELKARTKKDQDARMASINFGARIGWNAKKDPKLAAEHQKLVEAVVAIDRDNTAWLKRVIDKHGWPGRHMVGKEGAGQAWLLVQHADLDRAFQKKCLELMQKMPKGEVDPQNLAYLTDRVAVGQGKPQVYGTQLVFKDDKLVPQTPIADPKNVDKRRAALRMMPLKKYIEFCEKMMRGKSLPAAAKP